MRNHDYSQTRIPQPILKIRVQRGSRRRVDTVKFKEPVILETDVLIVGGGPAGLAAAIALRQRGLHATIVEARAPGIDKACGEGLMPDAVEALGLLGVNVTAADGHAFRGISFINSCDRVCASFPEGTGIGVRRPRLHDLLRRSAEIAGVVLHWESHVMLSEETPGPKASRLTATINGAPITYRWLVGADGHASSTRRWAGLDHSRRESLRYGFRRHYNVSPWSEFVEIYWGPAGQYYVTPVAADCVCVVYMTRNPKALRDDNLADFPELADRLSGATIVSQQRGAVSATKKLWRVANSTTALVGDASGSADSITGEGLAMTFRQAQALADSLAAGNLQSYEREHRRIGLLPHAMGQLMLTMDRWPKLEARALHALSTSPQLLSDLLSVHVGLKSPLHFALTGVPKLGWNLAFA